MKKCAPLLVIAAGSLWGTMGLFVRRLNAAGFTSMEIVEVRCLLTALLLLSGLGVCRRDLLRIRPKHIWPLAGAGILSIVCFNFCYFSTISLMSMSAAAILLYTAPVFVMLLSLPLFRERITARKLLALALAVAGCCLVCGVTGAAATLTGVGLLLGLGSGLGYALYSIFSRFSLNQGLGSLTITVYTFLFAAVGGAVFTDFSHLGSVIATGGPALWGLLLLYTVVTTVLPYLLYTAGLSFLENGKASVLASIEPVVATLLGFFVYGESPTLLAILGMVLVLAALALLSLEGLGRQPPSGPTA